MALGAIVLFCALVFLVYDQPQVRAALSPVRLRDSVTHLWSLDFGPVFLVGAVTLALTLMVPVNLLNVTVFAVLAPGPAFVTTMLGALLSATLSYHASAAIGRDAVFRIAGPRLERVKHMAWVKNNGIATFAIARLLPLAPYSVFNMAVGALGFRFRDFIIGSAIGLLPGKIVLALASHGLMDFFSRVA